MADCVPKHIAIILDGNGRWAKKRFLPRNIGHRYGAKNVEQICKDAYDLGVKYLTVYAFSTENWSRPDDEVSALMKLLEKYLRDFRIKAMDNNMQVKIIGDRAKLNEDIIKSISEVEVLTKDNTGLVFVIAINYGGRDELVRVIKRLLEEGIPSDKIDDKLILKYLDTKDIPDPELIIRTSGEQRLSNFLMWQSAYSELYFTDVLWPDFDKIELEKAIEYYKNRDRRFGGI